MKDRAELCRGLLRKARSDAIAMQASLAAHALDAACFHAQQSSEKCLKAFLVHHDIAYPHTHNLTKLIELSAGVDAAFGSLLPSGAVLTPYAVGLRYDDSFWPNHETAKEACALAQSVFQFVLDRLPEDISKSARG